MYTQFFGLNEKPFAITPDPRYLYLSRRHADALAHLLYGVSESGGFIQLTGEVGTGKTTLIRSLLEQLPERAQIALVLNPQLTTREFLESICQELGAGPARDDSIKGRIDTLNEHLLAAHAAGRRVVLIVDEAQNLGLELLEQVRLLTNLETAKHKLLQIILIGQPELREVLARPDMRQVAQRITGRYHLEPLGREDTAAYVRHRLKVAGAQGELFSSTALREIYRRSHGIPRLINVLADRALLAGYALEQTRIDRPLVRRSALEVFGRPLARRWRWRAAVAGAASMAALFVGAALWSHQQSRPPASSGSPDPAAATTATVRPQPTGPDDVVVAEQERQTRVSDAPRALATLLGAGELDAGMNQALADLFGLWGLAYDPDGAPACQQAQAQGLRCLYQHGPISELRRADRPAILTLRDERGDEHPVVLRSLSSQQAEIVSAGQAYRVDLGELSYYWFGDQLLLWRPGTPDLHDLVPGTRDEDVRWLRETLAKIEGNTSPASDSALYDPSLETRVREYQRSHRLTVDGIVGTQTQLALLSELDDADAPSLRGSP